MRQLACGSQLQPWKHFPNHQKPFKRFSTARAPASLHLSVSVCVWVYLLDTHCVDILMMISRFSFVSIELHDSTRCAAYLLTRLLRVQPIELLLLLLLLLLLYLHLQLFHCISISASASMHRHLSRAASLFFGWGGGRRFCNPINAPAAQINHNFIFYYYLFAYTVQIYCMFTQPEQTIAWRKPKKTRTMANKCEIFNTCLRIMKLKRRKQIVDKASLCLRCFYELINCLWEWNWYWVFLYQSSLMHQSLKFYLTPRTVQFICANTEGSFEFLWILRAFEEDNKMYVFAKNLQHKLRQWISTFRSILAVLIAY